VGTLICNIFFQQNKKISEVSVVSGSEKEGWPTALKLAITFPLQTVTNH
jgi:hypothetical protein